MQRTEKEQRTIDLPPNEDRHEVQPTEAFNSLKLPTADISYLRPERARVSRADDAVFLKPTDTQRERAANFWANDKANNPYDVDFHHAIETVANADGYDFSAGTFHSTQEILYSLSLTERGRVLLGELLPLMRNENNPLQLQSFDTPGGEEVLRLHNAVMQKRNSLLEIATIDKKPLALYSHGVIYIDQQRPLIQLLPYIAHEGRHAIDRSVPKTPLQHIYSGDKVAADLRLEHRAFYEQALMTQELVKMLPEFWRSKEHRATANNLLTFPSDKESFKRFMVKSYGFDSLAVSRYLENTSWECSLN